MGTLSETILSYPHRLAMPIATYPGAHLIGTDVRALVSNAAAQAEAQEAFHERFHTPFVMSAMDLSVEAEAFGSTVLITDDEVPTVTGRLVTDREGIERLAVPALGTKRTRVYLDTIRLLTHLTGEPLILGGLIGPFSLAGRLFGVSEALMLTAAEPDMLTKLLEKTTAFLKSYALAFKEAGANGIVMAEPTAGLMSPRSVREFSSPYINQIIRAVEDSSFSVILHNCGARITHLPPTLEAGARIMHFGKPMDIASALGQVSSDVILCGNLDPSEVFCGSTPEQVALKTHALLEATRSFRNFVPSSGCDVPAHAPKENLEAFYSTVDKFR